MNSHDILITALIVVIVAIQLLVFLSVFRRIKLFTRIFPDAHRFKTVKVYVPADRIVDITPEEILKSLYGQKDNENQEQLAISEEKEHSIAESQNQDEETLAEAIDEDELWLGDEADEVWMRNGNEELKVPMHLVQYYAEKGWKEINTIAKK